MNQALPSLYDLFAAKLTARPELLQMARDTCAQWLKDGHTGAARLREWDDLLADAQAHRDGFQKLLRVLAGTDESQGRLREFHPLAGILTREERRQARELCGYRH